MFKGIIFDLGGTLLHFEGHRTEVVRQGIQDLRTWYLKKKRVNLNPAAFLEAMMSEHAASLSQAVGTQQEVLMQDTIMKALQRINAPRHAIQMAQEGTRFFFQAEELAYTPIAEAKQTLKKLYLNGYKIGIMANAAEDGLVQRLVNDYDLRPWVSPVLSSASLGWRKPNPAGLTLIARRWPLSPSEILVVGDELETDILGAQQAGMPSVLMTGAKGKALMTAQMTPDKQIKPEATLQHLSELLPFLETFHEQFEKK